MKIEIHNYLSGSHILGAQPKGLDSIVILDSTIEYSQFVSEYSRRSIQLHMDDIVEAVPRKIIPSAESVGQAIQFGIESDNLVVCCRAGQSRSAAIAFAIAFEKMGESAALPILNPKRHSPNYRIIQIADGLIERPGLLNAYDRWRYASGDARLTDYLDEIEAEYDRLEALGARDRISGR